MIKVVPGRERAAYLSLKAVDGVLDVYHIFGEFDFFMIVEAAGLIHMSRLIEEIENIRYVVAARTILVGDNCGMKSMPSSLA